MNNVVTEIPLLDISTARNADGSFNEEFVTALRDAAHRVGFFQIVGYGAYAGQDQELLDTIAEFFRKPVEQKVKLDNRNSAQFRGYTRMGTEITRGRADAREQIDYGPERETLSVVPEDKPYLNLQGPNQFPARLPPARRARHGVGRTDEQDRPRAAFGHRRRPGPARRPLR